VQTNVPDVNLGASAVVIHYEEALHQVYGPLPFTFT